MKQQQNTQQHMTAARTYKSGLPMLVAFIYSLMLCGTANSANLDIAEQPMVLGSGLDPNVMFLLDSSGSMGYGINCDSYSGCGASRTSVMQSATNSILSAVQDEGFYIGISSFNTSGSADGSSVLQEVALLNSSSLSGMQTTVNGVGASGGTPLGEALEGMGWYFSYGSHNVDSILHHGQGVDTWEYTADIDDVFDYNPENASSRSFTPSANPIQNWCQKNFVIMLTDGDPSRDSGVTSHLRDYDGDCNTVFGDSTDNTGTGGTRRCGNTHTPSSTTTYECSGTWIDDYGWICDYTLRSGGTTCENREWVWTGSRWRRQWVDKGFRWGDLGTDSCSGTIIPTTVYDAGPYYPDDRDKKNTSVTGANYNYSQSDASDYLDDVADALYEMDLRPNLCDDVLRDEARSIYGDANIWCQDLVRTGSALAGQVSRTDGTQDRYYYEVCDFDALSALRATTPSATCSDLTATQQTSEDDRFINNVETYIVGFGSALKGYSLLNDAAQHGQNDTTAASLNASNGAALVDSFTEIFNDIESKVSGSFSRVAFNGQDLQAGESLIFIPRFNTDGWTGKLFAYELDQTGDFTDGTTSSDNIGLVSPRWEAGALLDALSTPAATRNIITYSGTDGVEFVSANWARFTTAMQNDLLELSDGTRGTQAGTGGGNAKIDFFRGDQTNERGGAGTDSFRARSSLLGDIVNSAPVFIGEPGFMPWGSLDGYSSHNWTTAELNRDPVLYAQSNGGMMHAFNGERLVGDGGGQELLAYIPSFIASDQDEKGLHYLTETTYAHKYYLDGQMTTTEAYIDVGSGDDWRTLLLGSAGAGGEGIYALDVTDPSLFADPTNNADEIMLWEFSSADDPDLGLTFSKPTVTKLENGRWAAIIGNGYNNGVADGTRGTGEAKLFILFLDGGIDGTWTPGTDYIEISTGVGSTATSNGLSTPLIVDMNNNGLADTIYAGDLYGNMWAFDLTDTSNTANWDVKYKLGVTPAPLFSAPAGQAITTKPAFTTRDGSSYPLILFGTGLYLQDTDALDDTRQAFYAVEDNGTDFNLDRSNLAERTSSPVGTLTFITENDTLDWSTDSGWYIHFITNPVESFAERLVTEAVVRNGLVFFTTNVPYDAGTCGTAGGYSLVYGLDPDDGLEFADGLIDLDGDGTLDRFAGVIIEGLASGVAFIGDELVVSVNTLDDSDTPTSDEILIAEPAKNVSATNEGMLYWYELMPD